MYENELHIYQSIKNIKKYCEANCNHGECKTCIFYSPFRYNCPFLDGIVPRNWGAFMNKAKEEIK